MVVIWIAVWIQGLFSGFVTTGRHGKWLMDTNLLLILIRQKAALARRALAEVCTVPRLLVIILFIPEQQVYIKTSMTLESPNLRLH